MTILNAVRYAFGEIVIVLAFLSNYVSQGLLHFGCWCLDIDPAELLEDDDD